MTITFHQHPSKTIQWIWDSQSKILRTWENGRLKDEIKAPYRGVIVRVARLYALVIYPKRLEEQIRLSTVLNALT